MKPKYPTVCVVLPCLNEARTVGVCVAKALRSLALNELPGQVVVVDNGSVDDSACVAANAGAEVIRCSIQGYGAAIRHGIASTNSDWIVMADADDSYDLEHLGPFFQAISDGADMVIGNRFLGGIAPGAMPWKNRFIGIPVLTGLLNLLHGAGIGDAHCGLRAFTRASYLRVNPVCDGMEFASELIVGAVRHGLKVVEVPTTLVADGRGRRSHLRPWRDGWRHVRYLVAARFTKSSVSRDEP